MHSYVSCCVQLVLGQETERGKLGWLAAQSCLLVISHRLRFAIVVSADGYGSDIVKVNVVC